MKNKFNSFAPLNNLTQPLATLFLFFFTSISAALPESNANSPLPPIKQEELHDIIEKIDPSIQFLPITPKLASALEIEELLEFDTGFSKWLLVFNEIPGEQPYELQEKRILQPNPNVFRHLEGVPQNDEIIDAKNRKKPITIIVSGRGYAPGEKVIWRLASKNSNIYKEITLYPRPIIIKDSLGKTIAKAFLSPNTLKPTTYNVDICGIPNKKQFELVSKSKHEKMRHTAKGPTKISITPDVIGKEGGVGELYINFEDQTSYKIELPWGTELIKHLKGNK